MLKINKPLPRSFLILFVLFFSCALFLPEVLANEAVAMVTDLQGKAVLTSKGEQKPCEILMSVSAGDEIRIDPESKLTLVYFETSKEYIFTGESLIRINANEPENKSGSQATTRDLEIAKKTGLLPIDGNYSQAAIVLRGVKNKPKIKLVRPVNSKVLSAQPIFEWTPLGEGTQYRFVLTNDTGRTVLETLVNGTNFKLPPENEIEEGVLYSWQVEARLSTGDVYSNSARFSILDDDERENINQLRPEDNATFSERIVFAMLLEQMGVHDEAHSYWKTLSAERPDNKLLKGKTKE